MPRFAGWRFTRVGQRSCLFVNNYRSYVKKRGRENQEMYERNKLFADLSSTIVRELN